MTSEKGIAEAFYYCTAENAVIKQENDTLIRGKENIRMYYERRRNVKATVNWIPDYIDVSDDGALGYTYAWCAFAPREHSTRSEKSRVHKRNREFYSQTTSLPRLSQQCHTES